MGAEQGRRLPIRPREEQLKSRWAGVADRIPVNHQQYSFDSAQREEAFVRAQFPTEREREAFRWYREEWYRRAKEFDPGPAPLAVCCELVSTCNLNCSICYTITEDYQMSIVGTQRMLPWPIVTAIIDECAAIGVCSLLFSWRGESTLYRSTAGGRTYRFPDVLRYAREKGILEITTLTNGHLIDEQMAREIVEAEPNWISVSIDGLTDVYNKIRAPRAGANGHDGFAKVVGNLRRLVQIRDAMGRTRPQLRTNTVYPAIANDPQAYHDFMEKLGIGWITVNELLDFRGTGLEHNGLPDEAVIRDWACQYPFQRLTVSANGIIVPCTGAHSEDTALVLGRYRGSAPKRVRAAGGAMVTVEAPETTLAQAWRSAQLEHIRMLHRTNRRTEIAPGCQNCRHGAVKHGVEWIPPDWDMNKMEWRGRVWRNG